MRNLVSVSNVEKFKSLQAIVNDTAPFIVKGLIARMQQKQPEIWANYCLDNDDQAAAFMVGELLGSVGNMLPENIAEEITYRYNMAITYQEVAQFNLMDDDEQQDQEIFWEYADRQTAFDERLEMYYNEW
ncbi:TPA: hypothetical protein N6Y90_004798, partial [Escherichia coli]|nr:hypothetical protein [Escherichia coli]